MGKGQNYRMPNFPFKCCTSKQKVSLHPPLLRVQLSDAAAGLWVSSYTAEMCAFGGGGLAGIAFFSFFYLYLWKHGRLFLLRAGTAANHTFGEGLQV